ncbi:ATP-binding protein [Rhodobium gokarnense]|uniref:histidine kinase n=1 Tax=Rhodobium gokarnense TaxID=364296 RepID=A0ABT3HG71_9HYPH|nr:ATP-binding protein [Rhodobium gokarnense]MCW2309387.1 signal transduction histidine kinase [Rhodobium gokarnense]
MKWLLPRSLLGQLVLLILAALVAAQAVSIWLFADERGHALRAAIGLETADRVATVVRLIEQARPDARAAILAAASSPSARFSIDAEPEVSDGDDDAPGIAGRIRSLLGDAVDRDIRASLVRTGPGGRSVVPPDMPRGMHQRMMGFGPVRMQVSVPLSTGGWLNMATRVRRPGLQRPPGFLLTTVLSVAGVVAALWFGLSRITGPLRRLAVAADRLGRGEDLPPLPASGPREVRALSEAFSDMQDRLTRLISDRTRMLAALGHDLRSPITALRLRAEMVDDAETHDRMVAILDEMQEMVEATLAYARGIASDEETETVDLTSLVDDLAAEVSEAGPSVTVEPAPPLSVRARRTAMRRALRNVLENAQRYGGGAAVRLEAAGGDARLVVMDDGPGIAPDALEHVFDPFVRLEASRSRETGGTGLGLSIARDILRAHGGDITLANRAEGGLAATIVVPLARDGH